MWTSIGMEIQFIRVWTALIVIRMQMSRIFLILNNWKELTVGSATMWQTKNFTLESMAELCNEMPPMHPRAPSVMEIIISCLAVMCDRAPTK
jgi:hypothetical protein